MGSKLLTATDRSGLSLAQVGGNDVYKMRHQVLSVLDMGGLGSDYIRLFAEPVDNDRSIDWYVEDGDKIEPVDKLEPGEKEKILARFEEMHNFLKGYAQNLRQESNQAIRNYADILDKALTVPGSDSLYAVDGAPVMANWGFSSGDNDSVEDSRKLIREIQKKRKEAQAEILKAQEAAKAAAAARAEAEARAAADAKTSPQAPEPTPPAKSPGTLMAVIIGALLVLAGMAAAWYFFWHKPEEQQPAEQKTPDFSWLKGDHTAKNVLVNENQEAVDLTLSFDRADGNGKAVVTEKGQTCHGTVSTKELADGKVEFFLSELACPNKNNYEPLTLICGRGASSCSGVGKNGEKWELDINIIGDVK